MELSDSAQFKYLQRAVKCSQRDTAQNIQAKSDKRFQISSQDTMTKVNTYFLENVVTFDYNLRNYIESIDELLKEEKNAIRRLHNQADECELYGFNLYSYLQQLARDNKIHSSDVDRIFVLSLNWPTGVKI